MSHLRLLLAALVLLWASEGLAQSPGGRLDVSVSDRSGTPLPGVTVTLEGVDQPRVTRQSDAEGMAIFTGLAGGLYRLKAELAGFRPTAYPGVPVSAGRGSRVTITLSADGE